MSGPGLWKGRSLDRASSRSSSVMVMEDEVRAALLDIVSSVSSKVDKADRGLLQLDQIEAK